MRSILFAASLFLLSLVTMGAGRMPDTIHCVLEWNDAEFHVSGELPTFPGAGYLEEAPEIPVYQELIELPGRRNQVNAVVAQPEELFFDNNSVLFRQLQSSIGNTYQITVEQVTIRKKPYALVSVNPFRTGDGLYRLGSFKLALEYDESEADVIEDILMSGSALAANTYQSVLSSGYWYKMGVRKSGIYRITYNDMVTMGFNPASIDPRNISIYSNGGDMLPEANSSPRIDDLYENAVYVHGEQDGVFNQGDYILFFGDEPQQWLFDKNTAMFRHLRHLYSDYTGYFITVSSQPGKRIASVNQVSDPKTHDVSRFQDFACHELEEHNLIKSGKLWFGEKFDILNSYDLPSFSFPNLDILKPVRVRSSVVARSFTETSFRIIVDGVQIITSVVPPVPNSYNTEYARMKIDEGWLNVVSSNIPVTVTYLPSSSSSVGWLDFVELNVTRMLQLSGSQMMFRDTLSAGPGRIAEFTLGNAGPSVAIWDITNPLDPFIVNASDNNNQKVFRLATDYLREFIAFDGSSYHKPEFLGSVPNQNLHALAPTDMVILSHKAFLEQAERLAAFHNGHNNYSVLIVSPEEIYNEFSSGHPDVSAIRDFIRMLYLRDTAGGELKYMLLFGDGTYDPLDRVNGDKHLLPAFQSYNSLQPTATYVTDDYFGLLDDSEGFNANGTLDIGIGRFPVETVEQAKTAVDKVIRYVTNESFQTGSPSASLQVPNFADWRNWVCFIADDEDGNLHLNQAEDLFDFVTANHPEYNIDKIYIDSYKQISTSGGQRYPEVNTAINDRVAKGALIMNYTGHGGEIGLGDERFVEIADINNWSNKYNMPVFVTATCEFSRFDDPERTSAGELVFLNPNGGGISLFSTTRVSFSSSNFALNMNFYNRVFDKLNGEFPKMGDVIRLAKTPSNTNIRNFVLLGDPALRLSYPEFNVETTAINGKPVSQGADTLHALQFVTIEGELEDDDGNLLDWFNGIIYPTVFDKPGEVVTWANDGGSSVKYFLRKNILYKGKASVVNGRFSFSFVVPKDIAYKFGNGRISYYATDDQRDASGYYEGIIIGGSEKNVAPDIHGPSVDLFMNDSNFVMGGITDENPVLLAYLKDSSGINTVGNGIGHDIVAILDGNTNQALVLNDYYEADLDSYQSGIVRYPFLDLAPGLHTLELRVWDVYNNSSSAYTEFIVRGSDEFVLNHLFNYPNPFRDETSFIFEHNHPGTDLDIEIRIFSLTGQLVHEIRSNVFTNGFRTPPIRWDGRGLNGNKLSAGYYVYKVRVDAGDGYTNELTEKLVLIK